MLPRMIHPGGISKWRSVDFGGIIHTLAAANGDIYDDCNVTSDDYPVLVSREARRRFLTGFAGKYGCLPIDGGYILIGDNLVYKDVTVTAASFDVMQAITPFNKYALLLPSKTWVRTDVIALGASLPASANYGDVYGVPSGTNYECFYWDGGAWQSVGMLCGDINSSVSVSAKFTNGTYAEETAEGNTIEAVELLFDWSDYFSVGDAVKISGAEDDENNKTIIVREIDGRYLRFYEHSFTVSTTPATITVSREIPDLDWICVNENRVWGCKKKTIYASKLGDFRNWNVFDGLASDSYAVDAMGEGDFTGCISFLGYPVFFKERAIYKVYGSKPSNYELMGSASMGAVNGRTLAIVDETLYYLSRDGVLAYNGGMPSPVSDVLGSLITGSSAAQAVSDGHKYCLWYNGATEYLEFDARKRTWHRQEIQGWDSTILYGCQYNGAAAWVSADYQLYAVQATGTAESVAWYVEFADMDEGVSDNPAYGANKKGTSKIQVRMVLGESSTAVISMMFDSDGVWRTVKEFSTENVKRSFYLPIIPRRSDHFRIKITGTGHFELYSLARENYKGSALRST